MTRRRRTSTTTAKPPPKKKQQPDPPSDEEEEQSSSSEEEEVAVPKPTKTKPAAKTTTSSSKTTTAAQRLTSSLQSFNTQSQQFHENQEFDYEELLDPDYLNAKISPTELTKRLKQIHLALKHHEQLPDKNSSAPWEPAFLEILLHKKILHNKNDEASLYLACIFADLIRITIPLEEWLYEDSREMKQVFMHILNNLRKLGDSHDGFNVTRFYLLERLSVAKTFALLTSEDMDAEQLIEELFSVFFDVVKDKESFIQQAIVYMEDIMVTVIEGSPVIPTSVLKYLLKALISKNQPIATQMAKVVFQRTAEYIAHPLGDQLNYELESKLYQETSTKERASLFKSIVALTLITSRLLLNTIPILIKNLRHEELNVRSSVIQLLGTMFSRPESALVDDYHELFKTFVDRCIDVEPRIRIYMAKFLQNMLLNHGPREEWIVDILNEKLADRTRDADEKVRLNVCEAIVNIMKQNIDLIKKTTIDALKERARDKKVALRIHVMKLISEVWREHSGQGDKVEWIPDCVVHSAVTVPNHSLLEVLIDQHLLTKDNTTDENDEQRALSFVTLVEQLDKFSMEVLRQYVFNNKNRYRVLLKRFITLVEQLGNEEVEDEEDKTKQLDQTILSLAQGLPDRDERSSVKYWETIKSKPEVVALLKKTLDPSTSLSDIDKIKAKISEKTYLGKSKENVEYGEAVFQKAATTIITKKQVEQIMDMYIDKKDEDALKALLFCAENLPYLFLDCYKQLVRMLQDTDNVVVTATLKILLSVGKGIEEVSYDIASDMEPRLLELAEEGTPKEAKYAARVISKIYVSPDILYGRMFRNLTGKLEYGPDIESVLSALAEVAAHSHETFATDAALVIDFIIDEIILKIKEDEDDSTSEELNLQTRCRLTGCKILSAYLVSMINSGSITADHDTIRKRVIELFWSLLEYDGNIISHLKKKQKRPFSSKWSKEGQAKKVKKTTKDEDGDEQMRDTNDEVEYQDGFGQFDAAMLRLGCVKSLIDLSSTSGHALTFTYERFLSLSYSILDPVLEVRKGVNRKLYSLLKTTKLGTRFIAMLLLGMMDTAPEQVASTKKYFTEIIPQLRREILSTNIGSPPTLDSEGSYQIFPEYALPYLIFLLAHHPHFSRMEPDFIELQKVLFTYFDVVTKGVDNLSFFHGLLTRIKTRVDVTAPTSTNHLVVCDLAMIILSRCAEGKNTSIAYPGRHFIPGFFRAEQQATTPGLTTPKRGFDTPRPQETPLGDQSAMQHLRTLYLGKDFKLHEKLARSVGTPQAVTVKKTTTTAKKPVAKSAKKNKVSSVRKRKSVGATPATKRRKKEDEDYTPRQSLPRSAKSSRKSLSDNEAESSDEEEVESESTSKKLDFSSEEEAADSDAEQKEEEEEAEEPTISVASRRRRRIK